MAILIYLIIHYSNTYFSFFFFFQFLIRKVRNCENFCFSNYYILHANISIFLLDIPKPNFLQIFAFENSRHFESPYFDRIPLLLILKLDRECVDLRVPIRCSHQWPRWIRVQKRGGEPHGCQWNAHKSCR